MKNGLSLVNLAGLLAIVSTSGIGQTRKYQIISKASTSSGAVIVEFGTLFQTMRL